LPTVSVMFETLLIPSTSECIAIVQGDTGTHLSGEM
jgi:hypothetical protein